MMWPSRSAAGQALPPPLGRLPGVQYHAQFVSKSTVAIDWHGGSKVIWLAILDRVKAMPGRTYNGKTKQWLVPNTDEVWKWLIAAGWEKPGLESTPAIPTVTTMPAAPATSAISTESAEAVDSSKNTAAAMQLDPSKLLPNLYNYQLDFLKFSLAVSRIGLFDEMGCGKTIEALAWLHYHNLFPALIVVNASTKLQWLDKWHQWLGTGNPVAVLSGRTLNSLPASSYIINWDILYNWERGTGKNNLYSVGFKAIVGDEVQAIGDRKSQRTRAFMRLAAKIPCMLGMSGTPARSKPVQLWPLLNCLSAEAFPNFYQYAETYCDPKDTLWGRTYNGATNPQELHALLAPMTLRRTKQQVMTQLPSKTVDIVPMEVDEALLKQYMDEAQQVQDSEASGAELLAKLAGLFHSAYLAKRDSCLHWIEDFLSSGEKLLIFVWHRSVVEDLQEQLSQYEPAIIYGGLSPETRDVAKNTFISNSQCRVLIANMQAGGVGIDGLQTVCSNCCFVELSATPNDHRQAEDRLHRGGQTKPVTVYYLVAPDTVDIRMAKALDKKAINLSQVIDGKDLEGDELLRSLLKRKGIK